MGMMGMMGWWMMMGMMQRGLRPWPSARIIGPLRAHNRRAHSARIRGGSWSNGDSKMIDETLDKLTTAGLVIVVLLVLAAFLTGCGGGEVEELDKTRPTEEPPCKSVPIERRQAECGT